MGIKHAFASAKADGGDATLIRPSNWNDDHVIDTYIDYPAIADPAAPAAGNVRVYGKDIAGRIFPKWIGPSGVDTPIQPFIGANSCRSVKPGSAAAATTHATALGTGFTSTATTFTAPTIATGTLLSRTRRWTQATNATAGQLATHRSTLVECSRETGFYFTTRIFLMTMAVGQRGFFGLTSSAAVATNIDPLSATAVTLAHLGLAINLNTGNWFITSNTAATIPTDLDLGASFPVNVTDFLELVLFAKPGDTSVGYRVTNLTTGASVTGTIASNLPALTQSLAVQHWMTNNATAGIVAWGSSGWYLETDF
jgi:hypothetical protein